MMSLFLDVDVFGKVSLLLMFELLFIEMVVVGQHHSVLRHGAGGNLYKTTLLGLAISAASLIFWILVVSIFFDSILSISKSLLLLLLSAAFLQGCIQILLASYRVAGRIYLYAIVRISYQLLKLTALYILLDLEGGVSFYPESLITAGLIILLVVLTIGLLDKSNDQKKNTLGPARLLDNVNIGFPLGFHAILGVTYTFVDRIMISKLLDLESLGIYQLASTFGLSAFFFVNVVALYFTPKIYANSDNPAKAKTLLTYFSVISVGGVCLFSIVMYGALVTFIQFFDETYLHIIPLFPYFVLVLIVQILNLYGLFGLTMLEKVRFIPLVTASALLVHMVLSQILIPLLGIKGAIISLLLCELIYASTLFFLFSLEYKRKVGNI